MTDDLASDPPTRPLPRLWVALLLLVVFACYAPSLGNGFALDDRLIVAAELPNGAANGMTGQLRPLSDYFSAGYWAGNEGEQSPLYRPITVLGYALTNAAFAGAAWPHHLLNLLLHAWATWLVLQILLQLVAGLPALVGAAVFGLHAIHSEVVAGIVGRAELLGFCLGAQALLWFLAGRQSGGSGRALRYGGAGVLLVLGFCSKESALAWAPNLWVIAIASDLARRRPSTMLRTAVQTAMVTALPIAVFLLLRHLAVGEVPSPFPVHYLSNQLYHEPAGTRVLTALSIWGFGLWKCLWPTGLTSDYGPMMFDIIHSASDYRVWLSLTALLGLLGVGLWRRRRDPLLFVGAAGFLGFSFLVSNVPFAIGTIFGERLYYTPSFGIVCLLAWVVGRVKRPAPILVPVGIWIAVSSLVILERNSAWADDQALMLREGQDWPRGLRNRDSYAKHLMQQGKGREAVEIWAAILRLDPQFVNAVSNYSSFLAANGRHDAAEKLFLASLQIPLARRPMHHITHHNLSVLYSKTNQPEKSRTQLRLAWQQDSAYELLHEPLLTQSQGQLRPEEMEAIIERGERELPKHPTWLLQRGYVALNRKQSDRAIDLLKRAHQARPKHILSRWVLSVALLQAGRKPEALPYLRRLRDDPLTPPDVLAQVKRALR